MQPSQDLVDDIYRERILRARRMSLEEKLCGGIELFHEVCARIRDGIRLQFPAADDAEVERILTKRLEGLRKLEEYRIYAPLPENRE